MAGSYQRLPLAVKGVDGRRTQQRALAPVTRASRRAGCFLFGSAGRTIWLGCWPRAAGGRADTHEEARIPAHAHTLAELREFERTRFDQIEDAINAGDLERVQELADAVQREFVPVHDGFMDTVTAILSHFVDLTSPEQGEEIGLRVMERHMAGPWFDQYLGAHGDSPESLRQRIVDVATTWHWHPTEFTMTEDDEKVTVHTHPCGSGMRLEQRGRYEGENAFKRSVRPSKSTFMEAGFPIYCNHCPEMNRAGLRKGATVWLVEGWKPVRDRGHGRCRQHSYKRLEDVPEEFYARVGFERPSEFAPQPSLRVRLFTDQELEELAAHPCDRLVGAFEAGSPEAALDLLEFARGGWSGMHGAYPIYLALLWNEARDSFGPDGLTDTLERTAPELITSVHEGDPWQWASFWSMHLYLREIRQEDGAYAFVVGERALVSEAFVGSTAEFCVALSRGVHARGWEGVGRFDAEGDAIVHRLPAPG
ncbi:MAG: hypothetical protein OXG37_05070 [Actinomycetia bacterium]|nr:hypothetical protein [Actinomycetes bacterium]